MQKKNEQIHSDAWLRGILIAAGGAVLALVLLTALTAAGVSPILSGILIAVLYCAAVAVWLFLAARRRGRPTAEAGFQSPVLGNIMLDMVQKLPDPVLICDEISERIIWHNKATADLVPAKKSLHGATVGTIVGRTAAQLMNDTDEDKTIAVEGRFFRTKGYRIHSAERVFFLIVFHEITELEDLRREAESRDLVVGYVMIDNVDEMLQYEQERYRSVASRIDTILRDWATDTGGILKEYERDRYLYLMTRESFRRCTAEKFGVLDTIRDIHFGDASQPVTISVGFADMTGTYAEKEKAAQAALDTALQRGGDQIVVRGDGETEFYGGRTKSVQKRTRVRSRVVATELVAMISRASGVLIMAHRFADFDAIGSAVGLARICMFCGVDVHIVVSRNDPNLRGPLAMLEKEPAYRGVFIDGAAGLDLVRTGTLLIITDVNNPKTVECPELAENCERFVIIDHHRKSSEMSREPELSYIEPSAAAASELVSEMLEQVLPDGGLLPAEANLLLAGILLDTKQFSKNTGTRTFSAALYLRDRGADPAVAQELFRTDLEDFRRETKFLSDVEIYRSKVAIAVAPDGGDAEDRVAAAKAADRLLSVAGVEASFALIRIGDTIHVSARSSGKINVQLILESCGGGGHFDAAGAQMPATDTRGAVDTIKHAVDAFLAGSED